MPPLIPITVFASIVSIAAAAETTAPLTEAEAEKAARIAPRDYPGLPKEIALDLELRGCTIPQSYVGSKPHNVIKGAFVRPNQTDWTVLCSKKQNSSIFVYVAGSPKRVEEIAPGRTEEINIERGVKGVTYFGFDRMITAVGKDYIDEHYQAYGGPTPPPIDHEGINDAFVEKASVVHYRHEGKWLQLTGAD